MARAPIEVLLRRDRALLIGSLGLLFLLAALYTIQGVGMSMSPVDMTAQRGMDMGPQMGAGAWSAGYAALVFLMWWVMMVAMMLPSVAPAVLLFAALQRHRSAAGPAASLVATLFLGGYLASWAGFSAVAALTQWASERAGLVSPSMMTLTSTVAGGLTLLAAGLFQLSPLKGTCLRLCQDPAEFLTRHYRPGLGGAVVTGALHGAYCVGCCWALMALLFVGGVMNLYWIVGLAALVALEKLAPRGEWFGRIAGLGLIAWGAVVLV